MPEISYKESNAYITKQKKTGFAPVYLIFGEEFLCQTALEKLLNLMLPGKQRSLNYEPFDAQVTIHDGINSLKTFSFLGETKVVALCESRLFYTKEDTTKLLVKAKEHLENNAEKKAAELFLHYLSLTDLDLYNMDAKAKTVLINSVPNENDDSWLDTLLSYCNEKKLRVPKSNDAAKLVERVLKEGYPAENHLIITTDYVDKRKRLYKTIKDIGVIINCDVPQGEKFADKKVQEGILKECMQALLKKNNKTAEPRVFHAICDITGFDLRTFANNIETLIIYCGKRPTITVSDVQDVLKRTKRDPIYDFTNAISGRNFHKAIFYFKSLLANGLFPLQIHSAIINQIRKLLVIKSFTHDTHRGVWQKGMPYDYFRNAVLPVLIEYEAALIEHQNHNSPFTTKGGKKLREKKSNSDLLLAKQPKNPYPIYMNFLKADLYTKNELIHHLTRLAELDRQLKTSGTNSVLLIEKVILDICTQTASNSR